MEYLTELSRLPEKEIKEKLGKNNYIGPGSLVYYEEDIRKVLARIGDQLFVSFGDRSKTFYTTTVDYVKPIDYELYRSLITKKYVEGTVFKTIHSLTSYLKRTLYKTYGEDRIDVQNNDPYIYVKVYFPEIVIKNSLEIEHTMTDVYLEITLRYDRDNCSTKYCETSLWRETYTPEEVNASYVFSHVSATPGEKTRHWCYGDTSFAKYLASIRKNINPKDLPFLIQQTKAYMEWESIEGTPYKYIANIKPYSFKGKNIAYTDHDIENLYNNVINELDEFRYDIDQVSEDFSLYIAPSLVKDIINKHVRDEIKLRNVNGKSGIIEELNTENIRLSIENNFIFKDKYLSPKIIPSKTSFDMSKLDEIYPKETPQVIIDKVISKLTSKFKEYLIKYKLEND